MYDHDSSTLLSLISDLAQRGLEAEEIAHQEAATSIEIERETHLHDRQRVLQLRQMQKRRESQVRSEVDTSRKLRQMLDEAARLIRERQTVLRSEGYQQHVFPDRARYEGEWRNSCIHGQGTMTSSDRKEEYDGEWFLGVRNGNGKQTSLTFGSTYIGKWHEGRRHGRCELFEPEGVYRGDFLDGNMTCNSNGEYVFENGQVFRGGWLSGFYEGFGVLVENSGSRYEGQWSQGRRHGKGIYRNSENSEVYDGDWDCDRRHGKGVFTCPEFSYQGEWKFDAMCGLGTKTFADGSIYDGEHFAGESHGHGTFLSDCAVRKSGGGGGINIVTTTSTSGGGEKSQQQGEQQNLVEHVLNSSSKEHTQQQQPDESFNENEQQQQQQQYGTESSAMSQSSNSSIFDGPKYCGEWEKGKRHGKGQYSYPAKRIQFEGEWFRGAKHGRGSFTFENQGSIVGFWHHDVLEGEAVLLRLAENFSHPVKLRFLHGTVVGRQDDDEVMLRRIVSLLPVDETNLALPLHGQHGSGDSNDNNIHSSPQKGGEGNEDIFENDDDEENDDGQKQKRRKNRPTSGGGSSSSAQQKKKERQRKHHHRLHHHDDQEENQNVIHISGSGDVVEEEPVITEENIEKQQKTLRLTPAHHQTSMTYPLLPAAAAVTSQSQSHPNMNKNPSTNKVAPATTVQTNFASSSAAQQSGVVAVANAANNNNNNDDDGATGEVTGDATPTAENEEQQDIAEHSSVEGQASPERNL